MQAWTVGGALVLSPEGLLLVQNRRRNGSLDWSPPGGVIDAGETMLEGLTREVLEETGLRVTRWSGLIYEVRAEAPGLGWTLHVETHLAAAYEGELALADPDGIVVDVGFVGHEHCPAHLEGAPTWVREPIVEWLGERWSDNRSFSYRVDGTSYGAIDVVRI